MKWLFNLFKSKKPIPVEESKCVRFIKKVFEFNLLGPKKIHIDDFEQRINFYLYYIDGIHFALTYYKCDKSYSLYIYNESDVIFYNCQQDAIDLILDKYNIRDRIDLIISDDFDREDKRAKEINDLLVKYLS